MRDELIPIGIAAQILGVSIKTVRRWDGAGRLKSRRTGTLGHRYYLKSEINAFLKDISVLAKNWVLASPAYEPEAEFYCQTRDIFQARLENFQAKLTQVTTIDIVSLITAVAGEIGNNSFDHNLGNWPDIPGIFFSYSMHNRTVVLADRGLGILTTLQRVRPKLNNSKDALKVAFTETISGRYPEVRGNGLKFVRAVITENPLTLDFQTGNAMLYLKRNDRNVNIKDTKIVIPGCFVIIGFDNLI